MTTFRFDSGAMIVAIFATIIVGTADAPHSAAQSLTEPAHVVFLVRHAETCPTDDGNPPLSAEGSKRANDLVRTLADIPLDAIYSTPLTRTRMTAAPIAKQQSVSVTESTLERGFLEELATTLKASDDSYSLVSGHSNTTPTLVNMLAGTDYPDLDEDVYDRLFIVTLNRDGTASTVSVRYGDTSGGQSGC